MCGVFGVFNHPEAIKLETIGLFGLNHRGQESAGIAWVNYGNLRLRKGMGLVFDVFPAPEGKPIRYKGKVAIGHTRYSTCGESLAENAQPHLAKTSDGQIALASNGDIVNFASLKSWLEEKGMEKLKTDNDGELLVKMIAFYYNEFKSKGSKCDIDYFRRMDWLVQAIKKTLKEAHGAISALVLTEHGELIAFRDPLGIRPLVYGYNLPSESWFFASETCALDPLGVDYQGEILPGEIRVLGKGMNRFFYPSENRAHCIFEHIYFSRPDGWVFGEYAAKIRMKLGSILAQEHPAKADYVVPVPDTAEYAAIGYSQVSGIPIMPGFTRSHYIGRTFIAHEQIIRDMGTKLKLNPVIELIKGKKIVLIDDSIVRGTTSRKIVRIAKQIKRLREGAKEVHMRITSPPIKYPCFFGIDTPTRKELIASDKSVEEIRQHICADSLGYLSLKGLLSCVKNPKNYCTACFTGKYPMDVSEKFKTAK